MTLIESNTIITLMNQYGNFGYDMIELMIIPKFHDDDYDILIISYYNEEKHDHRKFDIFIDDSIQFSSIERDKIYSRDEIFKMLTIKEVINNE